MDESKLRFLTALSAQIALMASSTFKVIKTEPSLADQGRQYTRMESTEVSQKSPHKLN